MILKPIGHFHKHLTEFGKGAFIPIRERTLRYIQGLNLAELPSREYEAISETLSVVKNLTITPEESAEIDECVLRNGFANLRNSSQVLFAGIAWRSH